MTLNHVRRGTGSPLVLVHGLGAGWRCWAPVLDELAQHREVIAVDLPGFGETAPLPGEVSVAALTDSVVGFIREQGLDGVSTVGQSMGGRMVLELARWGVGGDALALDPGGFRSYLEVAVFGATLRPSVAAVHALRRLLPVLFGNPVEGPYCWRSCRPGPGRSPARLCCRMWGGWPIHYRPAQRCMP